MFHGGSDTSWFLRIGILAFVLILGSIRLAISCCRDDEEREERRNRRARLRREAKEKAARARRDFVQNHLESYVYNGSTTSDVDPENGLERENDEENRNGSTKSELECAICLSSVRVGDVMAKPTGPTCKHKSFHYQCLSEYLAKSRKQTQCPICRGTFMKEDISHKTSPQSRDEDVADAGDADNEGQRTDDV